jgi:ABC-type lipoprotein release transport system permease subunit
VVKTYFTTVGFNHPRRIEIGIFIAFGLLIGAIIGIAMDQPSAGTVIGMAIGTVIAVVIWIMDRKRR